MATFHSSDGLELYYEDTGDGLPILCLPGLTRAGSLHLLDLGTLRDLPGWAGRPEEGDAQ